MSKLYECHNTACALGSPTDRGRFTGGATAEGVALKTGKPIESMKKGVDYGDGVCPECCKPAKLVEGETFVPHVGTDPNQKLHDELAGHIGPAREQVTRDLHQGNLTEEEAAAAHAALEVEAAAAQEKIKGNEVTV